MTKAKGIGWKKVVRKLSFAVLGILAMLFLFWLFPINVTRSMPYGVYMRLPKSNIQIGDLVEIDNPLLAGTYGVECSRGLVKRVEGITEDGLYWLRGETPASYDSRYFGAVGSEYIRHRLVPILVTRNLPECLKKEGI